ncbi:MAG TPA: TIGR02281 family clan AA aspartic protease [Paracoccaceae bacterium]|nr:TIGR02281 family clan AA aspartic protease [Paracoccaceae bacterium]
MRANMLFWSLVVLCLGVVAACLDGPVPGDFPGEAESDRGLVYLVVFAAGLSFAGAGRVLARGGARTARFAVVWTAVFAIAVTGYANREDLHPIYDRLRGNIYPSVALTTAEGEAQLRRAWDGHYRAQAEVNGVPMQLMIDTGASMVLLPYEKVQALGIDPGELDFSLPVTTANGMSTVAPIRLSSIRIGPIAAFDIEAAVAHPGRLKVGLLGMSFIDKLTEISFRGETLTLRN